jgi:LPXTG-motif cell wall-anchored protein
MCYFSPGACLKNGSRRYQKADEGISNFKFQISYARLRPLASAATGGLVVWWMLAVLATSAGAVTPTPVTNADGRIVQPVFPSQTQRVTVKASAPLPAAPDFTEQNHRQRWLLVGGMAGLLGIAAWYRKRRREQGT